MKKITLIILANLILVFFMRTDSIALDLSSVIVYPVPLNPYKNSLTIEDKHGVFVATIVKVKVEIFDINGDTVFMRDYINFAPIKWNGRNNSGKTVKPGLYIIKISAEELKTGAFGQRIIRILVKY